MCILTASDAQSTIVRAKKQASEENAGWRRSINKVPLLKNLKTLMCKEEKGKSLTLADGANAKDTVLLQFSIEIRCLN